jgi:hypothetical protein
VGSFYEKRPSETWIHDLAFAEKNADFTKILPAENLKENIDFVNIIENLYLELANEKKLLANYFSNKSNIFYDIPLDWIKKWENIFIINKLSFNRIHS